MKVDVGEEKVLEGSKSLPSEVINRIVSHIDTEEQKLFPVLLLLRPFHDAVIPHLYRDVTLTEKSMPSVFLGLSLPHDKAGSESTKRSSGGIQQTGARAKSKVKGAKRGKKGTSQQPQIKKKEDRESERKTTVGTTDGESEKCCKERHERKIRALSYIRSLTIIDTPSVELGTALLQHTQAVHHKDSTSSELPEVSLNRLTSLTIGEKPLWDFSDDHDMNTPHPFLSFLLSSANPTTLILRFVDTRTDDHENERFVPWLKRRYSRPMWETVSTVNDTWYVFEERHIYDLMAPVLDRWKDIAKLDISGYTGGIIPTPIGADVRVYYEFPECNCSKVKKCGCVRHDCDVEPYACTMGEKIARAMGYEGEGDDVMAGQEEAIERLKSITWIAHRRFQADRLFAETAEGVFSHFTDFKDWKKTKVAFRMEEGELFCAYCSEEYYINHWRNGGAGIFG